MHREGTYGGVKQNVPLGGDGDGPCQMLARPAGFLVIA